MLTKKHRPRASENAIGEQFIPIDIVRKLRSVIVKTYHQYIGTYDLDAYADNCLSAVGATINKETKAYFKKVMLGCLDFMQEDPKAKNQITKAVLSRALFLHVIRLHGRIPEVQSLLATDEPKSLDSTTVAELKDKINQLEERVRELEQEVQELTTELFVHEDIFDSLEIVNIEGRLVNIVPRRASHGFIAVSNADQIVSGGDTRQEAIESMRRFIGELSE